MSSRSISIEARERLRAHQESEAKTVSAHGVAMGRLSAATAKRAELVAAQDELVADAESNVAAAAAGVVEVSGLERAALILGIPKGSLRRQVASVKHRSAR